MCVEKIDHFARQSAAIKWDDTMYIRNLERNRPITQACDFPQWQYKLHLTLLLYLVHNLFRCYVGSTGVCIIISGYFGHN